MMEQRAVLEMDMSGRCAFNLLIVQVEDSSEENGNRAIHWLDVGPVLRWHVSLRLLSRLDMLQVVEQRFLPRIWSSTNNKFH